MSNKDYNVTKKVCFNQPYEKICINKPYQFKHK